MRRGAAFTLIAVILTGVVLAFSLTQDSNVRHERSAIGIVQNMNSVIDAFEQDLGRGLYITSYRTVIGQIEKITKTGVFINDTQTSFVEGMLNNTIENTTVSALDGSSLKDWLDKTQSIYHSRGYDFTYAIENLTERQLNATDLITAIDLDYNLSDARSERTFVRHAHVTAIIPVQGLEDPVYYIKSLGRISNLIEFTDTHDIPTLVAWSANDSRYVLSDKSPSFLMRLEGNFNASPDGIESIVNGGRFLLQGIGDYDGRSSVDTIYFSNLPDDPRCMSGQPSWFRMDASRLGDYTGSTNVTC